MSIINTEEKHIFTTSDTVTVLGLMLGVGLLVFSIVTNAMNNQTTGKAQIETQRLALQILSGGYQFKGLDKNQTEVRGLASERRVEPGLTPSGRIGVDPWGEPYFYRSFIDQSGQKVAVVYSSGPDLKSETSESSFVTDKDGHLVSVRFEGDDIGSIQKSMQ